MKQKYLILNDPENKLIKIQEFAELSKEMLSLLCEEAYPYHTIQSAILAGKDDLIAALRTNNMYPPGIYAKQIADAVTHLYQSEKSDSVELFFDDILLLNQNSDLLWMTACGQGRRWRFPLSTLFIRHYWMLFMKSLKFRSLRGCLAAEAAEPAILAVDILGPL